MANKKMFASASSGASRRGVPVTDTVNRAGGVAYSLSSKAALAQMAMTGTFSDTFYATAKRQLDEVKDLVAKVEPAFLAKLAVYARTKGHMKDLPAYLCAVLAQRDVALLAQVFDRVIDNGKMLRSFVQMVRSGQVGRRSLGTRPKKLVGQWLAKASDAQLLAASVGNEPSLADVIRLAHPKAPDAGREAFFRHLLGREVECEALLPETVRQLAAFRKGATTALPKVPFELLTSLPLSKADWVNIARNASWQQTRMNLATFARHGVFESREMVELVARRLADPEQVARARVFPYQLLAAYMHAGDSVPARVTNALQDALEHALANVPVFKQELALLVDVSWSMNDPVTGARPGATSVMRNVEVAGLLASALLRANPNALVVPFNTEVLDLRLNARDSVMTNSKALARLCTGGTNCPAGLRYLNAQNCMAEVVIMASDNESWVHGKRSMARDRGTGVMHEWAAYKQRVPKAKLVCIDISPEPTTQAPERRDILNVGGFSDEVFNIVGLFARGELGGEHWVGEIEKVSLLVH